MADKFTQTQTPTGVGGAGSLGEATAQGQKVNALKQAMGFVESAQKTAEVISDDVAQQHKLEGIMEAQKANSERSILDPEEAADLYSKEQEDYMSGNSQWSEAKAKAYFQATQANAEKYQTQAHEIRTVKQIKADTAIYANEILDEDFDAKSVISNIASKYGVSHTLVRDAFLANNHQRNVERMKGVMDNKQAFGQVMDSIKKEREKLMIPELFGTQSKQLGAQITQYNTIEKQYEKEAKQIWKDRALSYLDKAEFGNTQSNDIKDSFMANPYSQEFKDAVNDAYDNPREASKFTERYTKSWTDKNEALALMPKKFNALTTENTDVSQKNPIYKKEFNKAQTAYVYEQLIGAEKNPNLLANLSKQFELNEKNTKEAMGNYERNFLSDLSTPAQNEEQKAAKLNRMNSMVQMLRGAKDVENGSVLNGFSKGFVNDLYAANMYMKTHKGVEPAEAFSLIKSAETVNETMDDDIKEHMEGYKDNMDKTTYSEFQNVITNLNKKGLLAEGTTSVDEYAQILSNGITVYESKDFNGNDVKTKVSFKENDLNDASVYRPDTVESYLNPELAKNSQGKQTMALVLTKEELSAKLVDLSKDKDHGVATDIKVLKNNTIIATYGDGVKRKVINISKHIQTENSKRISEIENQKAKDSYNKYIEGLTTGKGTRDLTEQEIKGMKLVNQERMQYNKEVGGFVMDVLKTPGDILRSPADLGYNIGATLAGADFGPSIVESISQKDIDAMHQENINAGLNNKESKKIMKQGLVSELMEVEVFTKGLSGNDKFDTAAAINEYNWRIKYGISLIDKIEE